MVTTTRGLQESSEILAGYNLTYSRIHNSPVDAQCNSKLLKIKIKLIASVLLLGKKAVYRHRAECEILTQLNPSISLADIVMVGAALSRECIEHECAPTEMSNMFDENL